MVFTRRIISWMVAGCDIFQLSSFGCLRAIFHQRWVSLRVWRGMQTCLRGLPARWHHSQGKSCSRAFTFKDKREKILLLQEGTIGSKMYFVQEGIVDIVLASGEVCGKFFKSSSSLVVLTNDSTCRWRPLWVTDLTSVRSACWPRPGGWRVWGRRPTATSTASTRNTSMRSSRVIPSWREPWRVWQPKGQY